MQRESLAAGLRSCVCVFLCPGISAVPHFEISLKENPQIKQQFSGAQPVDTFVSVFSRLKVLSKV